MSVSGGFTWSGMKEFRAAIAALPEDITAEASDIVDTTATAALGEVRAAYPIGTDPRTAGQLRAGLRITTTRGKRGALRRELRSESRHAVMYEYGWVAHGPKRRHIPGKHVLVPIVMRHRARMEATLIAILEQSGLHVRG